MIRPATLWIALAISAPAFYQMVTRQLTVEDALLRFVLAVPVAMIMIMLLRFLTAGYGKRAAPAHPLRRRDDAADPPGDADTP
ncbi:MAG TPA: hypothetical protein VFY17_09845 [Pilimelia sp.]|nr:hypothetical protein [Pilimelia sp.]